jgi:hypothetical protein
MPITMRKAVNSTRSGSGRLRNEIAIGSPRVLGEKRLRCSGALALRRLLPSVRCLD